MAEDALESDFFQKLFRFVRDLLEPATDLFSDDAAKAELFGTLGLDPTTDLGSLPSTTKLDEYIEAEAKDLDAVMLGAAMDDLILLTLAIEGAIRAGIDAEEENPGLALDEILNAFLNVLAMDYVRRRSPVIFAGARLLSTVTAQTVELGGNLGLVETVVDFFDRLISDLDNEGNAEALSQTLLVGLGAAFLLIEHYILEANDVDNVLFKLGFGYEGISTNSPTPIADRIANRSVTYSVTATPFDGPDNQATVFNTLTLVPESHGGVALVTELSGEIDTTLPVSDAISFKIDMGGDGIFRIGAGDSASPGANNRVKVTFKHKVNKPASLKIFPAPVIKTGLKSYSLAVALSQDDFDLGFKSKVPFLIERDEDAGFPQNLLPKQIKEEIALSFGYSLKRELYFNFGVVFNPLEIRAPIHRNIGGVLGLQLLNLKLAVTDNAEKISLETSIDFYVKMGSALTISINRLGAELELVKREDNGGLCGRDLEARFKPPTGAGIAVDADVVKGGGFLYFDPDAGEYFGALELEFKETVALKAVGIINTIMPDGEKGFSMLILVTAEFSPISLAFGFTLDGVGGLLGVDRTVEVEALRVGVRTNAIRSILFPEDVVGNISRIVSDLRDFFPIKEGQFVVGLMAQLGYAGSDLVKIELGVVVEVPDPKVLILGVVRVAAPDADRDALKLQVNFLGLIDFPNSFAYFEAHLYDSHLVGFPLTGSLAFVVGWGDSGMFAASVGGFHPDFKDYPTVPTLPGAFRNMARVGFAIFGGNPSLTVQCYFGITSNTVQFGARAELLAEGPMGFNLYGMLSFDALFMRDPFSFVVPLEATLAIRKGRKILFGISFKGTLSGTNPWDIEGKVTFGLLFFDVTIPVNGTRGEELDELPPAFVDLVGMVRSELRDERNWRVSMSQGLHDTVTHRALEGLAEGEIVIYPFGELSFSQRTLPLDFEIERFGTQRPAGENRITIEEVRLADNVQETTRVKELFAAGQYMKLSEQEKLSRKSFERFDGGFAVKDSGKLITAAPDHAPVELDYELNYTDDDKQEKVVFGIAAQAFAQMHRHAAAAKSELGWTRSKDHVLNQVKAVELPAQGYAIARTDDLREVDDSLRSETLAQAMARRDHMVANDPSLEDELQVVFSHELAEA